MTAPKYTMTISLNVLDHLGLNLYSSTPAVLSEAVANAWDADAGRVEVTFDLGAGTITILDDGIGMTEHDINEKFLKVGYNRREATGARVLTAKGRHVMGRKGIGKLSLFAIASQVDIHTVHTGPDGSTERNALRMRTDQIRAAAERTDEYTPEALDPIVTRDLQRGTRIVLGELSKTINRATEGYLRTRLARRFSIIGPEHGFVVAINGDEVGVKDRDYFKKIQFLWSIGDVGDHYEKLATNAEKTTRLDGIVDAERGWKVSGWVGTVDEVKGLDEENNALVLQAWGKLVQEDLLASIQAGGLYTKYLLGELRADFLDLDDQPDIATSDRQRLKETDPRYAQIKQWVDENVMRMIGSSWRDWRNEKSLDDALQIPAIKEWYATLTARDDRAAAKKLFGKIGAVLKERESDKRELYAHTILAFEKLRARRALTAIDDLPDTADVALYQAVFGGQDEVEMVLYHQIADGRVRVLERFQGIVDNDEKEKVIQQYLYDHLWLLNPSWERPTAKKYIEQRVEKEWKKSGVKLTEEESRGRVDIRYLSAGGEHVIIELKRASVRTPFYMLLEQMRKYRSALEKILKHQFDEDHPSIQVIALVGVEPDEPPETARALALSGLNARIIPYGRLIEDALESYREYLEASEESSKLNRILGQLLDQVESDDTAEAA